MSSNLLTCINLIVCSRGLDLVATQKMQEIINAGLDGQNIDETFLD